MHRRRCISENLLDSTDEDFPSVCLEDFLRLNAVPAFATVFRTSTSDMPSRRVGRSAARWQEVYIHSLERVTNAVAEEVSFGEGRRRARAKRRRFLIPLGYSGWFEVLSQDGRCVRPIVSVDELSRMVPNTSCLVRETIDGLRRTEDGTFVALAVRKGQLLRPQETLWSAMRNDASKELLRCVDQRGEDVYLSLEDKGLFSQVACRSSIAGAHDIRSLLEKFRLPITVRLLHGSIFSPEDSGKHPGIFKLLGIHSEEVAKVLSLDATDRNDLGCWELIPIPKRQRDLMVRAVTDEWRTMNDELFSFLQKRCQCLVTTQADTIRPETLHNGHWLMDGLELHSKNLSPVRMELSEGENDVQVVPNSQTPDEEQLFREIEDLYAAVRCPQRSSNYPQHNDTLRIPNRFDTTAAFFHCTRVARAPFPPKRPAFHATNWKLQQRQYSTDDTCLPKRNLLTRYQGIGNEPHRKTITPVAVAPAGWSFSCNRLVPTMRLTARVKPMPRSIPKLGDGVRRLMQENHIYEKNPVLTTGGTSPIARARLLSGILADDSDSEQVRVTKENERCISTSSLQKISSNARIPRIRHPTDPTSLKRCGGSVAELNSDGEGRFHRDVSQRSFRPSVPAKPSRPVLLRPISYAGTALAEPLKTEHHGRLPALPPPLLPKRVASLSNLTQFKDADNRRSHSPGGARIVSAFLTSPILRSINLHPSNADAITKHIASSSECSIVQHLAPPAEYSVTTISGRSSTAKTFGTVSRSLARTLRRIGTKSNGSFDFSSSSLDDEVDDKCPRELWRKTVPHGAGITPSPSCLPPSPSSPRHPQLSILATANGALLSY